MEKNPHISKLKKVKQKLPTISHTKSNQNLINGKIPDLTANQSGNLQELRKLYYQYKSNANILTHSPYYTNRQHQLNVVSYIQANKCEPSEEQSKYIQEKYSIGQEVMERGKGKKVQNVRVKLHCFGVAL